MRSTVRTSSASGTVSLVSQRVVFETRCCLNPEVIGNELLQDLQQPHYHFLDDTNHDTIEFNVETQKPTR